MVRATVGAGKMQLGLVPPGTLVIGRAFGVPLLGSAPSSKRHPFSAAPAIAAAPGIQSACRSGQLKVCTLRITPLDETQTGPAAGRRHSALHHLSPKTMSTVASSTCCDQCSTRCPQKRVRVTLRGPRTLVSEALQWRAAIRLLGDGCTPMCKAVLCVTKGEKR